LQTVRLPDPTSSQDRVFLPGTIHFTLTVMADVGHYPGKFSTDDVEQADEDS
jgi:hypothetical protein